MDSMSDQIRKQLAERSAVSPLFSFDLSKTALTVLDLSVHNRELDAVNLSDPAAFSAWIDAVLHREEAAVGIGRYDEERVIYRHSPLFTRDREPRSIHLGIDIFVESGTPVSAPLPATVHSLAENTGVGDYGPTIILEHRLGPLSFWILYGHLTRSSLDTCRQGQEIGAGAVVGQVGEAHENGGWPPHLHFQLITDIGEWKGDFPGVAPPSERRRYLELCPDPNLILHLPGL